jgi:general stress protein 26
MVQLVTRKDGIEVIRRILRDVRVAMLTTEGLNGELHSRPMITLDMDFDGSVWFFARYDSSKVNEIQHEPRVNISYLGGSGYASLAGTAHIVHDVDRKRELWNEGLRVWLHEGPESPNVVLICVKADSGQYWEGNQTSALSKLLTVAKVFVLRDEEKEMGESGNVEL